MSKTPNWLQRHENQNLRDIIDDLQESLANLAYFSGSNPVKEVSEQQFVTLEETIAELEDIYIARVNALKRK
jgi:hypothetical protein